MSYLEYEGIETLEDSSMIKKLKKTTKIKLSWVLGLLFGGRTQTFKIHQIERFRLMNEDLKILKNELNEQAEQQKLQQKPSQTLNN